MATSDPPGHALKDWKSSEVEESPKCLNPDFQLDAQRNAEPIWAICKAHEILLPKKGNRMKAL